MLENSNNPVLSICIPTFNRSFFLIECLESVLESAKGYESKIEIIISDNASNDETTNVAAKYVEKFSFIHYNRNAENVIDENFFIAARLAKGKYVWIFADDDKMEKNAVTVVMDLIQKEYNLIILNYSMWDKYFKRIIKNKGFDKQYIIHFNNSDILLKTFGIKIQYLSSVVIEKERLLCLPQSEYQHYHEYGTSFLLSVYSGIKNYLNGVYVPEPLVAYRGFNSDISETKRWYKYFVTGSTILLETLQKKGYTKSAISKARNKVIVEYVARDLLYRKRNDINLNGVPKILFKTYKNNLFFWVLLLPLLVMPKNIIRMLKK